MIVVCARVLCRILDISAFAAHLERLRSLEFLHFPHDGWNSHIHSTAQQFDIDLTSNSQWKMAAELDSDAERGEVIAAPDAASGNHVGGRAGAG